MSVIGVAFIALGLVLSIALAYRLRSGVYVWLFLMHLAAAFYYWQYSLTTVVDAWGYYNYFDFETESGILTSTKLIGYIASTLRELLHAGYVDMFMIFHLCGYGGLAALHHVCCEAFPERLESRALSGLITAAMFIPGLHVWTSAIGKDAPIFLGVMCVVWGMYKPTRRIWSVAIGLIICGFIRPHVGGFLGIAALSSMIFSRQLSLAVRSLAVVLTIVGSVAAIPLILETVGLQSTGSADVVGYIEQRQGTNEGGSSVDISEYPFPLQFATYMFRPLFFDAHNALAVLVSFENLFYLGMFFWFGKRVVVECWRGERSDYLRFNAIFWLVSTSMFAITTSNLGLATRQKTMMIPSYLILVLAGCAASVRGRRPVYGRAGVRTQAAHGAPLLPLR